MAQQSQVPLGEERVHLLEEVARTLTDAKDFESTVRAGVRCGVPRFADLIVLLVHRDGVEDWLEVVQRDESQERHIADLVRPLLPAIRGVATKEWRQGRQFRWIPRVSEVTTRFLRDEPALLDLLRLLEVHSVMVVPLRSGGLILGAMGFARRGNRDPFHAADLAVAQVIARRLAVALQTTELHGRTLDEQSRRSRLEGALKKWIQVFDHAGWGAAIVDGQDYRIEAVNPAFARLHGYPAPDSLGGRLFTDLLAQDRVNEPLRWRTVDQPPPYESIHVRANGSSFPVLTNVTPLTSESGTTSYVVTVQDLTDLKRAEERLRRAQRLEAVGRLAGGVAHEVNNMMTIILGLSDLLVRGGGIPAERHRDIEEIRKAAARAGKITQQLLAFSRQQILQPTDLQINEVIEELVPVLRLLLPANIEVQTSPAPFSPTVHADRAQLDQVIINLVFNARDAMPGGGTLRLATDSRRLGEDDGKRLIGIPIAAGQYALLSVIDTGHGMDVATMTQVFEPFFTTKPVGSGSGLGLATVYGIVKQSGGYIWVESAPGIGTSVTVCLPQVLRDTSRTRGADAVDPASQGRTGTILVVEDEEGVRELAHRVLELHGHRVMAARDGDEALSLVEEFGSQVDLVLCDVIVPGSGITEFERRVRRLRPDLPVLYMSGYSRDEMMDRGLIDPARSFLQKPFTAKELAHQVSQQLEASAEPRGDRVTT